MGAKWNFRRVELAVVLVTVGLLLAGLGAIGNADRERAKGVVCLANLGQLSKGWHKFAEDHDGLLVGGCNYLTEWCKDRWVERPKRTPYYAGDPPSGLYNDYITDPSTVTFEHRKNGLKAGKLWSYIKNVNAYHCPADTRIVNPDPYPVFQSYAITGTMRAEEVNHWNPDISAYMKIQQIDQPETKLVFVEETVKNQWYQYGSWLIRVRTDSNGNFDYANYSWVDPLSNWHGNAGALSFADGHAILKRWEDQFTIEFNEAGLGVGGGSFPPADQKADITFMARGYGGLRR